MSRVLVWINVVCQCSTTRSLTACAFLCERVASLIEDPVVEQLWDSEPEFASALADGVMGPLTAAYLLYPPWELFFIHIEPKRIFSIYV